jgi:hypothetical protein
LRRWYFRREWQGFRNWTRYDQSMRLAAVTGCTADFTVGSCALLHGLKKHHPDVERLCYSPADQVAAVQSLLGDRATVMAIPRTLANAPDDPKILASWSRVFLPTLDYDAVAWFDSDVILGRPAPEWWQVPPGKINVVADRAYRIRHMVPHGMEDWYFGRFKLDPNARGFNAGVFAIRPGDHTGLAERFEELLGELDVRKQPFAMDQGLLNGLLNDKANWLPPEFNAHCIAECGVPRDVRVIHYTGNPKPWAKDYDRSSDGYYYWLRDGEGVEESRLRMVKLRSLAAKPRRLAYKVMRKAFSTVGLWNNELGVGRKPDEPRA